MTDDEFKAVAVEARKLVDILDPLVKTDGLLKEFEIDRGFFELVRDRARRLEESCVACKRRNRLTPSVDEIPNLLAQARRELTPIRGELANADQLTLDAHAMRIDQSQDSVKGFLVRVNPSA